MGSEGGGEDNVYSLHLCPACERHKERWAWPHGQDSVIQEQDFCRMCFCAREKQRGEEVRAPQVLWAFVP